MDQVYAVGSLASREVVAGRDMRGRLAGRDHDLLVRVHNEVGRVLLVCSWTVGAHLFLGV